MFRRRNKKEEEIVGENDLIETIKKIEEKNFELEKEETFKEEIIADIGISKMENSSSVSEDFVVDEDLVELEKKVKNNSEERTFISTKNYDETVVKLMDEVKIFNDDEDLALHQKRRIWPLILIITVLLGVSGALYYYFNIYDGNTSSKEIELSQTEKGEDVLYKYQETEGGIVFYRNNEIITTYECDGCKSYSLGDYEYFSTNPTLLAVQQDEEVFLYDYVLNKVVSEKYAHLKNVKQGDKTVAFIVTNNDNLTGIIDVQGNVLVPFEYEDFGYSKGDSELSDYSYDDDLITAKKNGYWGIINFKGEEVIPFEYDDIYYNGYKSLSVCVEGMWYLHDLKNNRLIETGYDMIVPIKSYVFASVNNIFYVLNYKGELIITKEIPTYLNTFRSRENSVTPAFKIEQTDTIVSIYIMNNDSTYNEYKFNTVNGELTEIIQ